MPTFHYKASRGANDTYEGTVELADRFAVYAEVRKGGGSVLSITEVGKGLHVDTKKFISFLGGIKTSDKIVFARNLGAMIAAGLSLSRALAVLERQTKKRRLKEVLAALNESIKQGKSLHEAIEQFPTIFPKLFGAMVKAGEESGKLSEALLGIAEQTERSYTLTKKIRGAMMYPGIVLTAMLLIGIAMLIFVVPTLTATFESFNVELPLTTRIIIAVSNWFTGNFILAIAVMAGSVFAFMTALRMPQGKLIFQWTLLHIPIIKGLTREINTARTARTFSSLLSSGVEVVTALSITREVVQNFYFREVLLEAENQIQKGLPIASVFSAHEDLYPPLMSELIAVGEETGQLSGMLLQIATFYENEVDQKTKNMSTIIEPFLMIVIGVGVGFFALSVISPIYSLSNAI
ncbi:MAG TPA: type II secretion system F family protein [Candidatus Paceibacterota bacterium]